MSTLEPIYYSIRHVTRFHYSAPVSESVTEVRKQPLQNGWQRRVKFELITNPAAEVTQYQEHWGNTVHQFNILPPHLRLELVAQAFVEVVPGPDVDLGRFSATDWSIFPPLQTAGKFWDYLHPSRYIEYTPALLDFMRSQKFAPAEGEGPLALVQRLMQHIYDRFAYRQAITTVHSLVDELLEKEAGVCQDFTQGQ